MKCLECQSDNREGAVFCKACGHSLPLGRVCLRCAHTNLPDSRFCEACGLDLTESSAPSLDHSQPNSNAPEFLVEEVLTTRSATEGELTHVTVLLSGLSGYTSLSDNLDLEEVKGITGRLFSALESVIERNGGFVEEYVGDTLMALFGIPDSHEDDPVRAVRAAREMHRLVGELDPKIGIPVGTALSMRSGISTGLVVTGKTNAENDSQGTAGDTVNVASRLCSLAEAGEILIGPETHRYIEGCFDCDSLAPVELEGKAEALRLFKVLSPKVEKPLTLHRVSRIRAQLTGRDEELDELWVAGERLQQGTGAIISLIGEPGTGKSRLVEEFKKTVTTPWLEGHGYPDAQNTPFSLVRDLLNDTFRIEEGDSSLLVREKLEKGIREVTGDGSEIVPYVGNLYSLRYDEPEQITPEHRRDLLGSAIKEILSGLTRISPTVVVFEDLQWADPSSVDLLRPLLVNFPLTCLFLCVYRPQFSLFTSFQTAALGGLYHEIRVNDLSSSESLQMVRSLLDTETISADLERFFEDRVPWNPSYLEELVNSLVDSGALIQDGGTWRLTKQMDVEKISSSVCGVTEARPDCVEEEVKHVLQEAPVIGRSFLYECAMEEADDHYGQAYRIVSARTEKTKEDASALIDILEKWAYSFYYRGNFKKFLEVFTAHEKEAASLCNDPKSVMFYAWLGWAYCVAGKVNIGYGNLVRARDMAEKLGDPKGLGYALTWLSVTAALMGKLEEGLDAGRRAVEIGKCFPSDHYLSFKGLFGIAMAHCAMGDLRSALADSEALLDYGRTYSDNRSLTAGYAYKGIVHFYKGDVGSAVEYGQKSVGVARDPFYVLSCETFLGGFYLLAGRITEAERVLRQVIEFDEKFNVFGAAGSAYLYLAVLNIIKGQIGEGVKAIKKLRDRCSADGNTWLYLMAEQFLGEAYLKMVEGGSPKSLSLLTRNTPFLLSNLPFAYGKSQEHLKEAIRVSTTIGAKLTQGRAYLDLGLLYGAKKRNEKAGECLSEAVRLLGECDADEFLRQAKEALESLGPRSAGCSTPRQVQSPAPDEEPTFYRLTPGVYVNPWPRFTMTYPKEWVEHRPEPQEVFRAGARGSAPYPYFVAVVLPSPLPLEALTGNLIILFKGATDVTLVSDKPSKLRDGTPAREVELRMFIKGAPFHALTLSTKKDDDVWITTALGSWNGKIGEDLKAILHSRQHRPSKDEPVKVPSDVQEFLDKWRKDILSHDVANVMTHYSDKYLNAGIRKGEVEQFWRGLIGRLASYEVGITDFDAVGDKVYLAGFTIGWWGKTMLQGTSIIKENSEWKWYGNQSDVAP
jgi:class 3 adenylate cyclase/tetratricopeptide (TPR) repeat protein